MNIALIAGVVCLAAGTFAFRLAGPALRRRLTFPPRVARLLEVGSVVLPTALAVTTMVPADHRARFALPAGVMVAAILAWRGAALVTVALAAATTAALLRWFGMA